ncbi:hypothetical protein NC661_07535 [Aquibacillus koreensis]|uniref:Uncharacterized protein n=1 Tax=Aquibacillus koreensis TaxID=279446 RepID=A0A9X4AHR0_9BACI|nr:hypothetical protein [Aquibacillus koreensis]MCT2535765.1 hypothetical protein [Aquibacillus koreensis]MDC3420221.1 hypothetical protein [Aquibacillus koreensis]
MKLNYRVIWRIMVSLMILTSILSSVVYQQYLSSSLLLIFALILVFAFLQAEKKAKEENR